MSDAAFAEFLLQRPDIKVAQALTRQPIGGGSEDRAEPLNKFGAKPTQVDGYLFASKMEADRWCILKVWQKAKLIHSLTNQHDNRKLHTWRLFEGKRVKGHKQRDIAYVDDFQYVQTDTGLLIVEDIKGHEPRGFKDKAKMFRQLYPDVHFFVNHDIRGWYTPER